MGLALNDLRFPGQGDLPGDNTSPNSPYYVEPAFDRDDAINSVAADLSKEGEVAELVMHVANAQALLAWIAKETVIPVHLRTEWAALERDAIALGRRIDREYAALNGEAA